MNSDLNPYLDETTNNLNKSDMAKTTKSPAKDSAQEVMESYKAKESIISDEIFIPSTVQPNFSVKIQGNVSQNQSELSNQVLGYRFLPAIVNAKTKREQYQMQLHESVITHKRLQT